MMNFEKLLQQIESVTTKKNYDNGDSNYWKMTKDKAGNATALIRFLPDKDISNVPFVRIFTHSFKEPSTNRWYIENSLSTNGIIDEVGRVNSELWNTGIEANKEIARNRKRKLNFIANILVLKDKEAPENEGKVFKFR